VASATLRAELSRRIRTTIPGEWAEFGTLWIAFNAIYGGEPDDRERDRVMGAIRHFVTEPSATRILKQCGDAIERIAALPPGDMRQDRHDQRFREQSQRCIAMYRAPKQRPVERLSAVAGMLYQVRCNLVHGSKDPEDDRDRMLVQESLKLLRDLLPAVEMGAGADSSEAEQ